MYPVDSQLSKRDNAPMNLLPEDDSEWQRLDGQRSDYAAAHKWARYRTVTLRMAQLRGRQGRLEDSLVTYLELCYIDLNGAQNPGAAWGLPIRDLDPERGFGLGPLIITRVRSLARDLGYDETRMEVEFRATATVMHRSLALPIAPEEAWHALRAELYRR